MATSTRTPQHASLIPAPSGRDRLLLRILAEQSVVPIDQLALFGSITEERAERVVKFFEQAGWVRSKQFNPDQPTWVWLTERGALLSETGFSAVKPAVSRLAHTRAINWVRLWLEKEAPDGRWICERQIRREAWSGPRRRKRAARFGWAATPDGVFVVEGDDGHPERWAIEVELTAKSAQRTERIVAEHASRYTVVFYFCAPAALSALKKVKDQFGNLVVRRLPMEAMKVSSVPALAKRARRGMPKPQEMPILTLLAEQGAIPVDQLARFMDFKLDKAKRVAKHLQDEGLIHREKLLAGEPEWLWLTKRGARLSELDLSAPRPRIGSLALMRATNEVRLEIAKRAPGARWISRRILLRKHGRNASVPKALIETGTERHALEIRLDPGKDSRIEEMVDRRLVDYDALVVFCAPQALRQMQRIKKAHGWGRVWVGELPGS